MLTWAFFLPLFQITVIISRYNSNNNNSFSPKGRKQGITASKYLATVANALALTLAFQLCPLKPRCSTGHLRNEPDKSTTSLQRSCWPRFRLSALNTHTLWTDEIIKYILCPWLWVNYWYYNPSLSLGVGW